MNLQDAFAEAIERPIKDLPRLSIICGAMGTELFIKNSHDELFLVNDVEDDHQRFDISTAELLSVNWEIRIAEGPGL